MTEAEFWLTKDNAELYVYDEDGNVQEISEWLYWFEENGVRDFDGDGVTSRFRFRLVIKDDE